MSDKSNILIKFLLFFYKKRYKEKQINMQYIGITYKKLFGKIYIINITGLPPIHPNCSCVIIGNYENWGL